MNLIRVLFAICWLLSHTLTWAADSVLTVAFNNKPPFFYFESGEAKGILVEQAKQVLQKAKVPYQFEELPFSRVLLELERKRPMFAALGFSKTPERESFAVFSKPLYRDRTPVILVRAADADIFRSHGTLQKVIDSGRFTFGGKQGNVYPIDPLLSSMGARDRRFSGESFRLPELLVLGRFDFTLMYPEELPVALSISAVSADKVQQVSYPDIPPGSYRYFLFSTAVPESLVNRVDQAIAAVIPKP